jgi:hypothetical protein
MTLSVWQGGGLIMEKDRRRPSLVGRGSRVTSEVSQGSFVFTYDFAGEAKQCAEPWVHGSAAS